MGAIVNLLLELAAEWHRRHAAGPVAECTGHVLSLPRNNNNEGAGIA